MIGFMVTPLPKNHLSREGGIGKIKDGRQIYPVDTTLGFPGLNEEIYSRWPLLQCEPQRH